jgi:glyoxylase I family protein
MRIALLAALLAAGCAGSPSGPEAPPAGARAMKLEHVAFMLPDPPAAAAWYTEHLGMRVVRRLDRPPFTHFLADASGDVMFEIYNNPASKMPDYAAVDPLAFHLAFVSDDLRRDRDRLVKAGATVAVEVGAVPLPGGDAMEILRDPWGVPLQLVHRAQPMLRHP